MKTWAYALGFFSFISIQSIQAAPNVHNMDVDCGSHNHGYRECSVHGRILSGRLKHQQSHARCVEGRTYGFTPRSVWVDKGCRGVFHVRVRSNHLDPMVSEEDFGDFEE